MKKIKNFKELQVWQRGIKLSKSIYEITEKFPAKENFGISAQMQRAAISVPANIAEGWSRNHTKEFIQFLHIAIGSLAELETFIEISKEIGYLKNREKEQEIQENISELQKMLYSFIKSLTSRL